MFIKKVGVIEPADTMTKDAETKRGLCSRVLFLLEGKATRVVAETSKSKEMV